MGYRLEISKIVYTGDCGGKLFGYISEEELHNCKSWQWLRDRWRIEGTEDVLDDVWDYGISHGTFLSGSDYKEFIKLYIKDYNKYSPYGGKLTLDNFKDSLKVAKEYGNLYIEWG